MNTIKIQISENPIIMYMKGSPQLPQCCFSAKAAQTLMQCGERFAFVNILDNPDIRATLPNYANWPTFPQLWVNGELIGGCDIIVDMYHSGKLQTILTGFSLPGQRAKSRSSGNHIHQRLLCF